MQASDHFHTDVALESQIDQVGLIVLATVSHLCISFHLVKRLLKEVELAQLVGIEHTIDLAFNLGEDELVLGHHVERLCLEDLLLVVHSQSLLTSDTALVLLLELDGELARLVVDVFLFRHGRPQFFVGQAHQFFCHTSSLH